MMQHFIFIFILCACFGSIKAAREMPIWVNGTRVNTATNHPVNIDRPSSVNTKVVSVAFLRSNPLPVSRVLATPHLTKTKTWVPTCPSRMPTICPCPSFTNSTMPKQFKKISEFAPTVSHRTYLRGGVHYTEKIVQKNLRGSNF
jgi:hypothetical protein